MEFIDLAAQQKVIREKVERNISAVLDHGRYILGPEVAELEKRLADFVGVKHCVGVANGTDALLMALMAKGIGPGDAVFTTPFTFIATAEVVSLLGATPVFVDIDPRTYNIDPEQLGRAIKAVQECDASEHPLPLADDGSPLALTPKAIIPVDLFGLPADYEPIMALARQYGLYVVEDAAQGLGGIYKGRQAGGFGHIGTTSFFPAKPLGCYGDGGAVFTDDDGLADIIRSIRVHGKGTDKYDNIRLGLNARLHTLQAAILLPKLEIFPAEIEARQRVAQRYTDGLKKCDTLVVPHVPEGCQSVWAQYTLLAEDRGTVQEALKAKGVPTAIYYGRCLHLQPAYANLHYKVGDFPVGETSSANVFSLPMHPYLDNETIDYIVEAVCSAMQAR
ncbi:MAG: aminotransferase DegT [Desulfobulbaceae bacterium DB1]|nr:MAG: aminotransferase DegT [Desulfobulbaceae bacterium DB1]